jgi:aminomethyltransferase
MLSTHILSNKKTFSFRGATATEFLEWLTPSSLSTLEPYTSTLSVLLNEQGGIIDDMMITKHAPDAFYVVTNAARGTEDLAWFAARLAEWNTSERSKDGPVEHEVLEGWGLLALQGSAVPLRTATSRLLTQDRSRGSGPPAGPDILRSARVDIWP